jgi:hypothetical protein
VRKSSGILTVVLCALFAAQLNAQPRLRVHEYWIGAHGGVIAGTVIFVPSADGMSPITNACVLGGTGGFVFRYAGHKYCHFQMELNYMHRGWATYDETNGHVYRNLHYIELPIFMNLNFGSEKCRWMLNLGPQIGYCVKDESKSIENPFDWGVALGTGVYFRTKHAGVYELEVRLDYSFGGVVGTGITDKHSMASLMDLSLNLGWFMPLRQKGKK